MSSFSSFLAVSLITLSAVVLTPLGARRHHTNLSIGIGSGYVEPIYVTRPYPGEYYGRCPRYARRIPPVYAYPHTVYYGPPGIVYEEIYPYPTCCEGRYY